MNAAVLCIRSEAGTVGHSYPLNPGFILNLLMCSCKGSVGNVAIGYQSQQDLDDVVILVINTGPTSRVSSIVTTSTSGPRT